MDAERFWSKVDKSGGPDACWPRESVRGTGKYGSASLHGITMPAHRAAYILAKGPIPDGLLILHSCDNPPCCNPAHLRAGTHSDNARDAHARGRNSAVPLPTNRPFSIRLTLERWAAVGNLATVYRLREKVNVNDNGAVERALKAACKAEGVTWPE